MKCLVLTLNLFNGESVPTVYEIVMLDGSVRFLCSLQEIEFLTNSIGQLKIVQTKYVEAKDSLSVINKNNKGE